MWNDSHERQEQSLPLRNNSLTLYPHPRLNKRLTISILLAFFLNAAGAQSLRISVATDLTLQHNFKKDQRFWAIGQTVHTHFHITPKEGVYAWFTYYSNGHFTNHVTATAKSPSTTPPSINYTNSASMRLKHFSLGYKKYMVGSADSEKGLNFYIFAGLGLLLGRVENSHSVAIDTATYNLPVLSGKANFKRLTLDPGLGIEHYLASDIYFYAEGRVWIPTTDYPSTYIFVNEDAPWAAMLNVGLRVLF